MSLTDDEILHRAEEIKRARRKAADRRRILSSRAINIEFDIEFGNQTFQVKDPTREQIIQVARFLGLT